jgi:hypothetical protein
LFVSSIEARLAAAASHNARQLKVGGEATIGVSLLAA